MKKNLLFLLMVLAAFSMRAEDNESGSAPSLSETQDPIVSGASLKEIVEKLEKSEGFVFLPLGEERNIRDIFHRSNEIHMAGDEIEEYKDVMNFKWTVGSEAIATITRVTASDAIYVHGTGYGETFLTGVAPDGETHHFAVFVCPTVTVLSPEGVVYTYQKVYNQPAKIQLSQSKDYQVNCVMVKGLHDDGQWHDVTAAVAKDADGQNDGFFESNEPVKRDLVFVISEEIRPVNEGSEGSVVGKSKLNLQVTGRTVKLVTVDNLEEGVDLSECGFTITDLSGVEAQYNLRSYDGVIEFDADGIYLINIEGPQNLEGNFKVIIHTL